MEPGQAEQLVDVLEKVSVGVAILDAATLHFRYVNSCARSLLDEPWCNQDVRGKKIDEVIPAKLYAIVYPFLMQVIASGQRFQHPEVPYEGFLETRGRTYWRVSIERTPVLNIPTQSSTEYSLLIIIEDVTETVRSRLHLNAIHYISSAIAGPFSLHLVLDRILQVLQDIFGSKRCTILLIDHALPGSETYASSPDEPSRVPPDLPRTVSVAAQKGLYPGSQDWHPPLNEEVLLGRIVQERHTLIITNTQTTPDLDFPSLEYHGTPCRPGSVLSVPIFEPKPALTHTSAEQHYDANPSDTVLGTIEVYHRRARGFPAEEVKLLERFAQQAGLAIQNARLFRSIDRWARTASRNARQKENVMQAMPDSVVIYDHRWRVADANHAARNLLGWSDDVIGLPIMQALECSDISFQADFIQSSDLGARFEQRALAAEIDEFKMVGANGQAYTMRCSYTPIRDELGDIFAFIIIYHDVTEEAAARERIEAEVIARTAELKQRNLALQQAKATQELTNARMALLLERLPSGVILVSANNTTITVINHHAVRLLQQIGVDLEPHDNPREASKRAIGMQCEQLLRNINLYTTSGSLVPYEEQPLFTALALGQTSEAELHITRRDGQAIHLLVNAAPLRASDGTVTSAILVLQEITRIKHLERAREDFFTTMAHELKTPLANIRAHLSALLARDLEWSSEEQYDFLQTADEQVERLVDMINHFLDASRVEAGALQLELEPLLLPELLEDLEERLEALIASTHKHLQITLSPQLPAVMGDYELIISVLINLLSNAFRYAPEGDAVQLTIETLFSVQQPIEVRFSVIDRGPGISTEQQAVLFTRFSTFAAMSRPSVDRPGQPAIERRRRSTRWSPATGLGLYISRGIIEAHNSKLQVISNLGQGATFMFTLPAFRGRQQKEEHATSNEHQSSALEGE